MKIENHKCFSLTKKGKTNPLDQIKARFGRADLVIRIFRKIRPEDLSLYISALKNKIEEAIGDYEFKSDAFDWEIIREEIINSVIVRNLIDGRLVFGQK